MGLPECQNKCGLLYGATVKRRITRTGIVTSSRLNGHRCISVIGHTMEPLIISQGRETGKKERGTKAVPAAPGFQRTVGKW